MGLNESVAEAALKLVQSLVEGGRGIVHYYQQFCQNPVLLQGDKLRANYRQSLFSLLASLALMPATQDIRILQMYDKSF